MMTVQNYKGHRAALNILPVTDEDVQAVYKNALAQNPRQAVVERPAMMGDVLVFDFAGFCGGEQFEGGTAQNYELELGSHRFIPGFEEQLVGMSAGESKDVNVTFPLQYTPELAGKDAVFKCTVHTVFEMQENKIDDEFVQKIFGCNTVEECDRLIRETLGQQNESDAKNQAMEQLLDAIAAENPCTAEKEEVDKEIDALIKYLIMNQTGQPMPVEQFCKAVGMPQEDLEEGFRPTAERNLHHRAVLAAIAEAEGIKATEEERMKQLAAMAGQFGMTADQFKGMIEDDDIDYNIVMQKTMDFIYANSVIEEKTE